ncbi:hypothetical protein HU200_008741 [Digitaria exilis]|uniref:Uncharacterized protein n=1 Tax=Digitaria exilis TaxID=1010633 RepID=A0A835KNH3_9POAL|nr:hypothetical protein HU200_008741 [Digitaria exilis]
MATALISGVFSVVGKALAPLKDGLLKDWAASVELGDNVEALELELLSAKAVLEHTVGKEIADNSAFRALLVRLQDLGYDAEDVLDELDYFRIQDQLHGTSAAADTHAKGFVRNMALHAKAVGKQIICLPACLSPGAKATHHHQEVNGGKAKRAFCCNISHTVIGKCVPCSSSPTPSVHDDNFDDDEPTKLRFNRVDASKRMKLIVEQLRLVQKKVSGIIAALGPSWSTAPNIAQSRLITSSDPTESRLYGRELMMSSIIHDITEGKHSAGLLTVIPIVGPGGIGKTTLAQHIYHNEKVQKHFDVKACENGSTHYILHDLLHELARKVSAHECLSIDSSESLVSSLKVLPSIRHLSINIDNNSVKDRLTLKNCVEDFSTLDKKELKVEKLRTLMLFGEQHGCLVKVFGYVFREATALRVVYLSKVSYHVEVLLRNFYNLVHLRYLRIQGSDFLDQTIVHLPITFSRFYHMMVLEVQEYQISVRDISNLVKLRHFLVKSYSSIAEVGKLKSLQELRNFEVKQECQGFELRQIGDLVELCGSLCIGGLENVQVAEEADEEKLIQKRRLEELELCWRSWRLSDFDTRNDSALQEHVIERFKPSCNLKNLSISGNRGDTCPSWLGTSLAMKNLECLCLDGVAWNMFPPIGELCLVNVSGEEIPSIIPEKRFENLRQLVLMGLPQLKRWVVHAHCDIHLKCQVPVEELVIEHWSVSGKELTQLLSCFPKLSDLTLRSSEAAVDRALFKAEPPLLVLVFMFPLPELPGQARSRVSDYCLFPRSSVCGLTIRWRFTEEQEILLFVNSLNMITFDSCNSLQYLPARLHRLPNLKILEIKHCKAIQMLPKDSLPSSLQELEIEDCPEIRSLPEDGLPSSLRRLHIFYCPAIQSLPKVDDLPNSLRELDIKRCGNEELKRQCRGLIGTIPIVKTD